MKRTPLSRKSQLRRHKPLTARRRKQGDAPEYLQAVRELGYCMAGWFFNRTNECWGPLDPHHAGRRPGTGLKASDTTAIPMCRWHHGALEQLYGPFHHWTKARVRTWEDSAIAKVRAVVLPMLEAAA